MIACDVIPNWETLVGFVVLVLAAGFVLAVAIARDPTSKRTRFGFFVERDRARVNGDE